MCLGGGGGERERGGRGEKKLTFLYISYFDMATLNFTRLTKIIICRSFCHIGTGERSLPFGLFNYYRTRVGHRK